MHLVVIEMMLLQLQYTWSIKCRQKFYISRLRCRSYLLTFPYPQYLCFLLKSLDVLHLFVHKTQCTKLDPCAVRCLFFGIWITPKGLQMLWSCSQANLYHHGCDIPWRRAFSPTKITNLALQGKTTSEEPNWLVISEGETSNLTIENLKEVSGMIKRMYNHSWT